MVRQDITVLIAIDPTGAFNTVDNNILLEMLHRKFGVAEAALDLLASYLSPQYCTVNVNNFYSIENPCSSPEGSVVGPILYTVYASTMESVLEASNQTEDTVITSNLRKKPDLHDFANDISCSKNTFKASDRQAGTLAVSDLEHSALNIKNWMDYNRLKKNDARLNSSCLELRYNW